MYIKNLKKKKKKRTNEKVLFVKINISQIVKYLRMIYIRKNEIKIYLGKIFRNVQFKKKIVSNTCNKSKVKQSKRNTN
ncbi:hypothetical protein PGB90_004337 [Kerria lacca]